MLPLAVGMQVAICADHLDRSPEKALLKGRIGRVHSWLWNDNDRRPSVIYVHFEGASWQLDGTDMPGLYPVRPTTRSWHLDPRRKPPVLQIKRTQIPLTPAYAMTAHSSQGKTLAAVLLDLCVDKKVDVTFGAVAASRVRSRHDCLILRSFEHWLFTRGVPEGAALLLKVLRGERIDWEAYREGRMPRAACKNCGEVRPMDHFDHENWERVRANAGLPLCLTCKRKSGKVEKRKLDSGAFKYVCGGCKVSKVEDAFPRAQLKGRKSAIEPRCLRCCLAATTLACSGCATTKDVAEFDPTMLTMPEANAACRSCQEEARKKRRVFGWFSCRVCSQYHLASGGASCGNGPQTRRCLNCASRGTRQKDEQTCRKKGCKRKFSEPSRQGQKRQRYCPQCRHE